MYVPLAPTNASIEKKPVRIARKRQAARLERLEARALLSATVNSPLPLQVVQENIVSSVDLSTHFTDPAFPDTVVQFTTNLGTFDVEVFNHDTPQTVANFLQYVNNGLYNGTIIHRVVNDQTTTPPFQIVQGGGFTTNGTPISTFATVPNEFHFPNQVGTIAMAKPANQPDGASSQWFINDSTNPGLDDPSNDGGFTVFGRVIVGMPVVDGIDQLPTVDGTALNPQFGTQLPVITPTPTTGSATDASNLVTVQSAAVIPTVSYTATSDNLELVNPTVNGTVLSFNPAPGRSGFCHVTVVGTDLLGKSVTQSILVEVAPSAGRSLDVTLGSGQPRTVSYKAANGTRASITLGGKGTAIVHFAGDQMRLARGGGLHIVGANVQVMGIDATGTTASSALNIVGRGPRGGVVVMGPITTDGAFNTVRMKRAVLEGNLTAPAGLGSINIDYANSGTIATSTPLRPGKLLPIKEISWSDVSIDSAAPISTIVTTSWSNTDSVSESVIAPYVKSIRSKGSFTPGLQLSGAGAPHGRPIGTLNIRGAIGGVWNFPGGLSSLAVGGTESDFNGIFTTPLHSFIDRGDFGGSLTAPSIASLLIHGALVGNLTLTAPLAVGAFDLGTLSVGAAITMSNIRSTGNIGSIVARSIDTSTIFAGVGTIASGATLPQVATDFAADAEIKSITLHPRKKVLGFDSSFVAAFVLGKLQLVSLQTSSAAGAFGFAARSIVALDARDNSTMATLALKNVQSAAQLAQIVAADHLTLGQLEIILVS